MKKSISFVIPCYNSKKTIKFVVEEIETVIKNQFDCEYEIILVNDCSPDQVWEEITMLSNRQNIKAISLAKNVGKHAALMAGYSKAMGEYIVSVDDDGQCPVEELNRLLSPLIEGDYDIAVAQYGIKKENLLKRMGSSLNNVMASSLIGKPKELQLSNFFAMKAFVCQEMLRYKNAYPYIDGLYLRSTQRITNVPMQDRNRLEGKTNYTLKKSLALFINGFTAFSVKPLRISTFLGLLCAFVGFIYALIIIINKFIYPDISVGYSSLMAIVLFIGGMIMMMLGLIGEYIGRIYISINNSPQYVIRETINIDQSKEKKSESEFKLSKN